MGCGCSSRAKQREKDMMQAHEVSDDEFYSTMTEHPPADEDSGHDDEEDDAAAEAAAVQEKIKKYDELALADCVSEEERGSVRQLVQRLHGMPVDEGAAGGVNAATALRFLRATDWNIDSAEDMMREMLEWRAEYDTYFKCSAWDEEVRCNSSVRAKLVNQFVFNGLVNEANGVPIHMSRFGLGDPAGMVRESDFEVLKLTYLSMLERQYDAMRDVSVAKGKFVSQFVEIVDMDGEDVPCGPVEPYWSRGMAAVPHMIQLAPIMDHFYPERIKKVFIVNAPGGFSMVWKLISPFVPKKTEEKIGIYGSTGWIEDMLKTVASDQIPEWLDERKTDEERNMAREATRLHGGVVPEGQACVIKEQEKQLLSKEGIGRGSYELMSIEPPPASIQRIPNKSITASEFQSSMMDKSQD